MQEPKPRSRFAVPPRVSGAIKTVVGIAAAAVGSYYLYSSAQKAQPISPKLGGLIVGVPAMIAVMGLIELFSGMSIGQCAARWNELPAWKQLVLSIALILVCVAVLIGFVVVLNP